MKKVNFLIIFLLVAISSAFAIEPETTQTAISSFIQKAKDFYNSFSIWVNALTYVVTACTAITILTPSKTDDRIVNKLLKVLNFLAGNFGKNKNADDWTYKERLF